TSSASGPEAASADRPAIALTPPEDALLRERDYLAQQMSEFRRQGKLREGIAAAGTMLAIEREIFGSDDLDVAGSLRQLAEMQALTGDFAAARKSGDELVAIQTR